MHLKLQVKDDSGGRAFVLLQNEWASQCSGLQKGDTLIISGAFLQPVRQAIQSRFASRSWRCLSSFISVVLRSWIGKVAWQAKAISRTMIPLRSLH